MFGLFKRDESQYVSYDWHKMRQREWEQFMKTCEKFDYVKFSNGRATGYMKNELPSIGDKTPKTLQEMIGQANKGRCILIPFEVVTPIY